MLTKGGAQTPSRSRAEKRELLTRQEQAGLTGADGVHYLCLARQSSAKAREDLPGMTEEAFVLLERENVDTSMLPLDVEGQEGMYLLEGNQVDVLYAVESAGSYFITLRDGTRVLSPWAAKLHELIESGKYQVVVAARMDRWCRDSTISANLKETLAKNRITLLTKEGRIEAWTDSGAFELNLYSTLAEKQKRDLVHQTKSAQARGLANGIWTLPGEPPLGLKLREQTVNGKRTRVPEWDEDELRLVAAVVEDRALARGSRDIARRRLIGMQMRKGAGPVVKANRTTDNIVRRICTEHRSLYEHGKLEVIFKINDAYVAKTLTLPAPLGIFDFMPLPSKFAAAQRETEAKRVGRKPESLSPVVGLFSWTAPSGETEKLKSIFYSNTRKRHLQARDEEGKTVMSFYCEDLEDSLLAQVSSVLKTILSDDLENLRREAEPAPRRADSLEGEFRSLTESLRKVLLEKTMTTHSTSIEQLTAMQRDLEGRISEIQVRMGEAQLPGPKLPLDKHLANDIQAVITSDDLQSRRRVRELLHDLLVDPLIETTGDWSATLYWARGSQFYSHPITGTVNNRARLTVRKKAMERTPTALWMEGLNVDEIVSKINDDGRVIDRASVIYQYLRPNLGTTLATTTSSLVQSVAIGVMTGDHSLEMAHGEGWAKRIRSLYFDADGSVNTAGQFGVWGVDRQGPNRDKVVEFLKKCGGSAPVADVAAFIKRGLWDLRADINGWQSRRATTSVGLDPSGQIVSFWKCPHCRSATPTELACPEPTGPVCAECGRDETGLVFDSSFLGAFLRGYPLKDLN